MKNINVNIILKACIIMLFPLLFLACEDENAGDYTPDQLFRPVKFSSSTSGSSVNFSWVPVANSSISLEISKDSLAFTNDLQIITLDEVTLYTVENLYSLTRYSARIKSVSKVVGISDSEYSEITFVTGTENIFYATESEDITANSINVKWNNLKEVSSLILSTDGVDDVIINLSGNEKAAGEKLIEGLTPGTLYTVQILNGDMLRGTIVVTTLP